MDKLAAHLIEKETITGKEFVEIYEEITGIKLKKRNSEGKIVEEEEEEEKQEKNEAENEVENKEGEE